MDERAQINEARKRRMMGGNLKLEDRTNPVCRFRCLRCNKEMFFRWFDAMRMWPYHCQQSVHYHGEVK